jgi:hypothetical protein
MRGARNDPHEAFELWVSVIETDEKGKPIRMKDAGQLGHGINGAPRPIREAITGLDLARQLVEPGDPEFVDQNGSYTEGVHGLEGCIDHSRADMELSVDDIHETSSLFCVYISEPIRSI